METSTDNEDTMDDLQKKYSRVRNLLESRGEIPSESGPALLRKTEALSILKAMQDRLENALNSHNDRTEKLNDMLAVINLDIGIISIDNEEPKIGEEHLTRCLSALADDETSPRRVLAATSASNQLGLVWFQWNDSSKAEFFLKKAEKIYNDYKLSESGEPVSMAALFGVVDDGEPAPDQILDKLYTLTLYYLAQVYGAVKDHRQSAKYCHMTLQRQLNHDDLDHIDWALNAATLAQFFTERQDFRHARHHLAAASHILRKYEASLGERPAVGETDEAAEAKWERYGHRSADVARCWAKYGIVLMSASRDRLIESADNCASEKRSESDSLTVDSREEKDLLFDEMEFDSLKTDVEGTADRVTDRFLLDFDDARSVFLDVQRWLQEAEKYYNFESHASDYVQIIEDKSRAFKFLAFFEEDEERQAKMHKRRIDLLTPVVEQLNPRYYQTECRQLWIELAEIHSAILTIKVDKMRASDDRPAPRALNKINNLAQLAIDYYRKFLDSLKQSEESPAVTEFSDEMVSPALYAYFHLGTLYNKIISPDKRVQLENVKKSYAAYKFFVDYCESYPELTESMTHELIVCKDLVNLLPLKINKLSQATLSN